VIGNGFGHLTENLRLPHQEAEDEKPTKPVSDHYTYTIPNVLTFSQVTWHACVRANAKPVAEQPAANGVIVHDTSAGGETADQTAQTRSICGACKRHTGEAYLYSVTLRR
jgi:hypothetical protein